MKLLFDQVSAQVCKLTTRTYSTSFSWGIYFLNPRLRNHIYAIYGFVRLADEIVDSFHDYNKVHLLERLRRDTYDAIEQKISCNPILNAFQQTVHTYEVDMNLVETFLQSMEMDLYKVLYSSIGYQQYILGSAEVVGLMCLHVFTNGNKEQFNELKPYAMKLGAAFQKVNFLRDMKHDYSVLGRIYFPGVSWDAFNAHEKKRIEEEIEQDFDIALKGIKKLPSSSKRGVYLAYVYYRSLFKKIRKLNCEQLLNNRIRISNGRKFGLMVNSLVDYKMKVV